MHCECQWLSYVHPRHSSHPPLINFDKSQWVRNWALIFNFWGFEVLKQSNVLEIQNIFGECWWWFYVLPISGIVWFTHLWESMFRLRPQIVILNSSALLSQPSQQPPPNVYQRLDPRHQELISPISDQFMQRSKSAKFGLNFQPQSSFSRSCFKTQQHT